MKTLTAAEILKARDFKIESVDVPEWGGVVYIREFSARAREDFFEAYQGDDKDQIKDASARVVAYAACDESGTLLFTPEQVAELATRCSAVIERVADRAAALNKLRKKDQEGEKKESASPPPAG